MHILCLGLNHLTSSIHLRERLVLNEEQCRVALAHYDRSSISEMVILSTCNRTEIYAVSEEPSFHELETFLSESRGVDAQGLRPYLYCIQDLNAVKHLFQVAGGLNSLVIGESQILGQVTRALNVARGEHATGPILNRLFQAAIHAGKRARAETTISRNPASVSSLAASVAEKALGQITSASVVILGAGEAGELMVEALRKRGVKNIKVINRTLARAQELARLWKADAVPFEFLQQALCETDILISSTSALQFVVTKQMVRQAMQTRTLRPMVLIDLAVPRDMDPSVASIPHVKLFDIDGLNEHLGNSLASRMNEVPRVQQILDEEASLFRQFLNSLAVLPMISEMYEQAETIRAAELQKTFRYMPNLTDAERKRIEALTQSLVKKILDQPTRHLRNDSASSDASRYPLLINN